MKEFNPKMGLPNLKNYRSLPPASYWQHWPKRTFEQAPVGKSWVSSKKLREMATRYGYTDWARLERVVERLENGACRNWNSGFCKFNDSCKYAHIRLCRFQEQCRNPINCRFYHTNRNNNGGFLRAGNSNQSFLMRQQDFPPLVGRGRNPGRF